MTNSNLFKSLQAFQEECPSLTKSTEGYGYKYVTLEQMLGTINPILKKHGLMVHQQVHSEEAETFMIRTTVMHLETGENLASNFKAPTLTQEKGMNAMQSLGSSISYLRRYMLMSALNLATVDDDAAGSAPINDGTDQRPESEIRESKHIGGQPFPDRSKLPWLNKHERGSHLVTKVWSQVCDEIQRGLITVDDLNDRFRINRENRAELEALLIFPDEPQNNGGQQ